MSDVVVKVGIVDSAMEVLTNNDISMNFRKGVLALLLDEPEVFEKYFTPGGNAKAAGVAVNTATGQTYQNPQNLSALEINYCVSGQKINAIRECRTRAGIGLKEAKDEIDDFCRLNNI